MQVADTEDTTEGGLLMAGSSKEKPTLGTVCMLVVSAYNALYGWAALNCCGKH